MKTALVTALLSAATLFAPALTLAQTYYYDGGSISVSDLRRARPYKKGTFLLQGGKRGIIWIPRYDARGKHYLELMMEHFLQGAKEILDYSPIQIGTIVGGSHGIASVLALLMDLDARHWLEIDKEQGEQINELVVDLRKRLNEKVQEIQRQTPQAPPVEIVLARTSEIERLSMTLEARLEAILKPEQLRRAKEIVFQLYGGFETPVVDLGILSIFNLSRPQREKLELIAEDANQRRDKIFAAAEQRHLGPADMQAFNDAMGDVTFIVARKVGEVLTPEQRRYGADLMSKTDEVRARLKLTKD